MKGNEFRIASALARARELGVAVNKKELALLLWGENEKSAVVQMIMLMQGKRKSVTPQMVRTICDYCQCTPNYLFGYED